MFTAKALLTFRSINTKDVIRENAMVSNKSWQCSFSSRNENLTACVNTEFSIPMAKAVCLRAQPLVVKLSPVCNTTLYTKPVLLSAQLERMWKNFWLILKDIKKDILIYGNQQQPGWESKEGQSYRSGKTETLATQGQHPVWGSSVQWKTQLKEKSSTSELGEAGVKLFL